jgi:hypothetical protein
MTPTSLKTRVGIAIGLLLPGIVGDLAWGQVQESARVRVLIAVDRRANLEGIEQNFQNIKILCDMLKQNGIRCLPDFLDGNDVTPASILNYYTNLDCRPDDTLVFYYTGHGGTDPNFGHFLSTAGGTMNILRSTVRDMMVAKKPHVVIILTDCCSLSGRLMTPFAPGVGMPLEKLLKDLFLRHGGVVDITAASYRGPDDAEAAYFTPKVGGVFTTALMETLASARTVNLDSDGDGFYSWRDLMPKLVDNTGFQFAQYKSHVRSGAITLASKTEYARLVNQRTQTPQAFSLGSKGPAPAEPPAPRGRRVRFGAMIADNYGFGIRIVEVFDQSAASAVTVLGQVGNVPTTRVAPLVPGDTIRVANGVKITNVDDFLRALDAVPGGGMLRFDGDDGGENLRSTFRAEVRLPD